MKVLIVNSISAHIDAISPRVREADRLELLAFARATPEQTMYQGLLHSKICRTGFVNGQAVCMFGVSSLGELGRLGCPWLVGTDLLEKHSFLFLRRCSGEIRKMLSEFDRLENFVDARNLQAIAWLKWLNFEFSDTVPVGPYKAPFIKFTMENNHER